MSGGTETSQVPHLVRKCIVVPSADGMWVNFVGCLSSGKTGRDLRASKSRTYCQLSPWFNLTVPVRSSWEAKRRTSWNTGPETHVGAATFRADHHLCILYRGQDTDSSFRRSPGDNYHAVVSLSLCRCFSGCYRAGGDETRCKGTFTAQGFREPCKFVETPVLLSSHLKYQPP
ncbi:hypothetical protein BC835DRAFT_241015 [Cytidiella melzeri]|nr:hypothetical protein BC835DRAFT_241015 [Cytidiella melzeri]